MAKKFYETDKFKTENAIWTKKLSDSGFVDIEASEDEYIVRPEIISTESKQLLSSPSYQELCQAILKEYKFTKDVHRIIFTRHAEGLSEREICQWLKSNTHVEFSQKGINLLINRVKENYLKGINQ